MNDQHTPDWLLAILAEQKRQYEAAHNTLASQVKVRLAEKDAEIAKLRDELARYGAQPAADHTALLRRWLSFGRGINAELARHLIADTEAALDAAQASGKPAVPMTEDEKERVRQFNVSALADLLDDEQKAALRAALAAQAIGQDAEDAARYRWLRGHFRFAADSECEIWFDGSLKHSPADQLDAAIDAAMRKESKQ